MISKDSRFMDAAKVAASASPFPDASGALIVMANGKVSAAGTDGLLRGIEPTPENLAKPHLRVSAVEAAIHDAALCGLPTRQEVGLPCGGATLYLTRFPSLADARLIAGAGMAEVVLPLAELRRPVEDDTREVLARTVLREVEP